ncbi:hypothetical protein BS47DRAFT_513403 [Hydnum rufescens UP504]|uniref:Uncharacterized protein n=1 Tax=Hydnum rufescens UP504 TaxID=1448309 RepID=A0A9P6DJS6_9AGAM|nr:hypothetical protein BS47DRAFT_513403 [Hydnum rufescens UP504]
MMDGAPADTVHSTQSSPSTVQVHFFRSDRYSGNHASQSAPCISSPPMASDGTPPPPPAVQSDGLHSLPASRLSLPPVSAPPTFHPSPSTHTLEPESPSNTRNPRHRLRPTRTAARNHRNRSLYQRVREFLGHGNPSRRRIVDAYSSLVYCFLQIIIVATFVGLTRSVWRSPRSIDHGMSEWDACGKPLGPLAIVWIIRTALETARSSRRVSTHPPAVPDGPSIPNNTPPQPRSATVSVTGWDRLYDQVQTLVSLIVIAHFLATNVLLYSSVNTCRISSPHLWWLSFAILCITYVVILEILLICLTVFVLMPILFVVLNLFLICTGHRPISARQLIDPAHINPETPKMPQKLVDKIPLVLYIPIRSSSPVEVPPTGAASSPNEHVSHANAELAADGFVEGQVDEYAYPPGAIKCEPESTTIAAPASSTAGAGPSTSPTIANTSTGAVSKRPRFAIFRRQSSASGASVPRVKSGTSAKGKSSRDALANIAS